MFVRLTDNRLWKIAVAAGVLIPILTGCALFGGAVAEPGVEQQSAQENRADAEPADARDSDDGFFEAEEAPMEEAAPPVGAEEATGGLGGGPAGEPLPMATAALAPESLAEGDRGGGGGAFAADGVAVAPAVVPQQAIEMKAGEIDDNAQWDDYLLYRREFLGDGFYPVHDVDVTGRHIINVRTADDFPVLGARVRVYAGQALVSDTRTYATGQTLFFPNADSRYAGEDSYQVSVEKGGATEDFTLNVNETNEWFVTLRGVEPAGQQVNLDVLFLIDATGSMADEIEQLQSNILAISAQIDALPSRPNTRYGMVTYRDRGDEYVTRVYDFTPDVTEFQTDLDRVRAAGGGDTPESLNEAMYDAIHRTEWRVDDTVSLMFLVADAAPHLDYGNDADYAEEMVEAARLGIKVHPIASSGLEPQGEFIFRQIGQYTMGHFIFLTYEGEQGGFERPDLEAGSSDYSVEALDELVLRLIEDELAALRRR